MRRDDVLDIEIRLRTISEPPLFRDKLAKKIRLIQADDVERVLADINAEDGDCVENLGHGVLLVWVPPASIRRLGGARPDHPISGHRPDERTFTLLCQHPTTVRAVHFCIRLYSRPKRLFQRPARLEC